jgi:hypothetical protein
MLQLSAAFSPLSSTNFARETRPSVTTQYTSHNRFTTGVYRQSFGDIDAPLCDTNVFRGVHSHYVTVELRAPFFCHCLPALVLDASEVLPE